MYNETAISLWLRHEYGRLYVVYIHAFDRWELRLEGTKATDVIEVSEELALQLIKEISDVNDPEQLPISIRST